MCGGSPGELEDGRILPYRVTPYTRCLQWQSPWLILFFQVPFLDLVGAMADEDLPLTAHETDEWGDPFSDPGLNCFL